MKLFYNRKLNVILFWLKKTLKKKGIGNPKVVSDDLEVSEQGLADPSCFLTFLLDRKGRLEGHAKGLYEVASRMEKVHKGIIAANITGSCLSAVGAMATTVGLALSPVTLGASLVMSAVGLGVAMAGGGLTVTSDISESLRGSSELQKATAITEMYKIHVKEIIKRFSSVPVQEVMDYLDLKHLGEATSAAMEDLIYLVATFRADSIFLPKYPEELSKGSWRVIIAKVQKLAEKIQSHITVLGNICAILQSVENLEI
uniref:Apolipoprotein L domain containing 1 n=2 Tax=Latimeria chalumnae TaxID=7897 RepID=H3B9A9_LATCH